jgi:hypothetical protein
LKGLFLYHCTKSNKVIMQFESIRIKLNLFQQQFFTGAQTLQRLPAVIYIGEVRGQQLPEEELLHGAQFCRHLLQRQQGSEL